MTRIMLALAISANVACGLGATAQGATTRSRTLQVQVTAYCDQGETASGVQTRRGIVAADPDVLPLGSRIRVEGLDARHNGTYDVQDTGSAVKGRIIDIFMADCAAAKRFGRQTARVQVLRVGDDPR